MDEKRLVMIGVGTVLVVSSIIILAVTMSGTLDETPVTPEVEKNWTNPLLLISLDGFRSDYIFRYAPTLEMMAMNGVMARYLMPTYPTVTFPNHYTIITGLYPESHGIVTNFFYDPDFNESFTMETKEGKWWGGEPIWNTLTRQNKTSATYFWPGSDSNITGLHPTYWRLFNKSVAFEKRVDQVVEWLAMSEGRPDFVSLYFDEPDGSGHKYGPDSFEVDNKIAYVDGMISRLLAGLRRHDLEDKVNIIVLADHGMATAGEHKIVNLPKYVPNINDSALYISYGAFTMLKLKPNENVKGILTNLSCPDEAPYIRAFESKDLPTRLHYSNNKRIGEIVLDFDQGYYTRYPDGPIEYGEHGYDNHQSTMNAIFIATGPDFQNNTILEPFQNIEIYNLMCLLTGVDPAPNNGTEGSLYAALLDPPPLSDFPQEDVPPPAEMQEINNDTFAIANCSENPLTQEDTMQLKTLNISKEEQEALRPLHFPWGVPSPSNLSADTVLLYHEDHITGYSQRIKMPLWTSFTVNARPQGSSEITTWLSDVRLNKNTTQTCDSYSNNPDIKMSPLFPRAFSTNKTLTRIPYLVSNAVPRYPQHISSPVDYIYNFLESSMMADSFPFNVVLGPVFDNDRDSFPDDFANFTNPQIPSDFFAVITRCRQSVNLMEECDEENLDAITFIAPIRQTVNNNCKRDRNYAAFYLSTVHDVEMATGFTFFPAFNSSALRLQLSLKIHRNLWMN